MFFHDCDVFYVFFFFMMLCLIFYFFCFSFLNNWLENIERTITLHVFYFKHMENSKQTTTFFISHTWRTLNKHWLCIYLFKFILALALGLVFFWPLLSEKRIEQQILQISQTAPTAAWWQAVRCQWWLTNKKQIMWCVCVGGRAMPMLGLVGQRTVSQFFPGLVASK